MTGRFEIAIPDKCYLTSQNVSGVFRPSGTATNILYDMQNPTVSSGSTGTSFDASKDSAIYSGPSVQPKALNCLPCIRI